MTSVFKIHDTVLRVSNKAQNLVPEIPFVRSELKLLSELILCILSSREKYEVALGIMKILKKQNVLKIPKNKVDLKEIKSKIQFILENPVSYRSNRRQYSRRLRFFSKKVYYIISTIENIYLNNLTIKNILNRGFHVYEMRKNIINNCNGIGPKQASMFLRNIGYFTEFAVLDKHIIDYMRIMGLTDVSITGLSNILKYQKVESKLKSYAETYNINLLHLDLGIWTTMRNIKYYQE